jgi:DNA topoisomerase I
MRRLIGLERAMAGQGAMQPEDDDDEDRGFAAETDPEAAARAAKSVGLRYVTDAMPGITRRRAGRAFSYRDPQGRVITARQELARIRALAIPPAWTAVWICPFPNGHLQATGRDARGRKQYRYHQEWRVVRDSHKFDRTLIFARALPQIRARVEADLRRPGLPREKVLATILRLLETTLIRVGNAEYARDNKSYGLTTFRDRHVEFNGAEVAFEFRGKSGKLHKVSLRDRRLARIVRACQDLPGQELFQYIDSEGVRRDVDSADVNAYLQEITGEPFTAKDFRTWAGTVLASLALSEFESFDTQAAAKRNVTSAIEQVAKRLGNTVAVCRKSYIHPAILDSYLDGSLLGFLKGEVEAVLREDLEGLSGEEAAVLAFLQQRLTREVDRRRQQTPPRDLKKTLRAAVTQEAKAARPS